MTAKNLKEEILSKKSLFKKGRQWLAGKFKVSLSIVDQVMEELKDEKRKYRSELTIPTGSRAEDILEEMGLVPESFVYELPNYKTVVKYKGGDPNNVLVVGDLHEPFTKDGYLEFCRDIQEKYNCGSVAFIGDILDNHAVSYHEHDSEGKSAGDEYTWAISKLKRWYETFPEAVITIGNHDALPFRKIFTSGLPSYWLKSYQQLTESPEGWKWDFTHEINGVIYTHGTGMSGEMASINAARENRQSTVIGHLHTVANIKFMASYKDLIFGMTVPCGIDFSAYAFAYGKQQTRKPVIGCGVVLNGRTPIIETMKL